MSDAFERVAGHACLRQPPPKSKLQVALLSLGMTDGQSRAFNPGKYVKCLAAEDEIP